MKFDSSSSYVPAVPLHRVILLAGDRCIPTDVAAISVARERTGLIRARRTALMHSLLFSTLHLELFGPSLELFLRFRLFVLRTGASAKLTNHVADRVFSRLSALTRAMISWIFSSCDSPSKMFRICCRLAFSLYPRDTTSSKALRSSNEFARMAGSDMAGVRAVINRTTSDKVDISCKIRATTVDKQCPS